MSEKPPNRALAIVLAVFLPSYAAGHWYVGQYRRGSFWVGVSLVGVLAFSNLGSFFEGAGMVGVFAAVGLLLVGWLGAVVDLMLIPRSRLTRVSWWKFGLIIVGLVFVFMGASEVARQSVEAFRMPSGSMAPTFFIGDHILVGKKDVQPPSRGKIVAFVYPFSKPDTEPQTFVKRVVGLPGDTLEFDAGHSIINGWRVPECKVGAYAVEEPGSIFLPGELFVEFLGEAAYLVWYHDDFAHQFEGPFHVEPNEVWVLGDNRHNSSDSRRWRGGEGAGVPYDHIVGRTLFIWMSDHPGRFGAELDAASLTKSFPDQIATGIQNCLTQRPSQTLPPANPAAVQP